MTRAWKLAQYGDGRNPWLGQDGGKSIKANLALNCVEYTLFTTLGLRLVDFLPKRKLVRYASSSERSFADPDTVRRRERSELQISHDDGRETELDDRDPFDPVLVLIRDQDASNRLLDRRLFSVRFFFFKNPPPPRSQKLPFVSPKNP